MSTWGAVFDWDGVIVNSAEQHEASWERLAEEEGKTLPPDHFKRGFGMKNEFIIPKILGWAEAADEIRRISLRKEELYREVVKERGIKALPGVKEFLDYLVANSIPRIIGSSTQRLNITTALEVIGLADYFDDLVTSEDVSHGKPDPEVFLKCAGKIGVEPERCCVFEDTEVGIEAALAGKMHIIALETTHPRDTLTAADLIVKRLDEIPETVWTEWFAAKV